MAERSKIEFSRLRDVIDYEPESGILTWRATLSNRALSGSIAGTKNADGYIQVKIYGRIYKAHNIIWLFVTGEWPDREIDHRDMDGLNNKWINLRKAGRSLNNANQSLRIDNTSGYKGVYFNKSRRLWYAQISFNKKTRHLGYFQSKLGAASAYMRAAHELFGEFARY